jgi:hypothetical protein
MKQEIKTPMVAPYVVNSSALRTPDMMTAGDQLLLQRFENFRDEGNYVFLMCYMHLPALMRLLARIQLCLEARAIAG